MNHHAPVIDESVDTECGEGRCRCPVSLPLLRPILDEWLLELAQHFFGLRIVRRPLDLASATMDLYCRRTIAHVVGQTASILDVVLPAWPELSRLDLQGIGAAAFSISAKLHASEPAGIDEIANLTDGACNAAQLIRFELQIMNMLWWRIPGLLDLAPVVDPQMDALLLPRRRSFVDDAEIVDPPPYQASSSNESYVDETPSHDEPETDEFYVDTVPDADLTPPEGIRVDSRQWTKRNGCLYVVPR